MSDITNPELDLFLRQFHLELKKLEHLLNKPAKFNVFTSLLSASDEVNLHSKFLGFLLDPRSPHGLGSYPLQQFWQILFSDNETVQAPSENEFQSAIVNVEYAIDGQRRIDLCIQIGERFLVVENKIWAGDQPKQVTDYLEWSTKKNSTNGLPVVYLTLDGHLPSIESFIRAKDDSIDETKVLCISYRNEVREWLECMGQKSFKNAGLRETLIQYKELIEQITGVMTMNENELRQVELFLQKDEHLAMLPLMEEAIIRTKVTVLYDLFWQWLLELQNVLHATAFQNNEFVTSLVNDAFRKDLTAYVRQVRGSKYSGCSIKLGSIGDYNLYFRLELDVEIYWGFHPSKAGKGGFAQDDALNEYRSISQDVIQTTDPKNRHWLSWHHVSIPKDCFGTSLALAEMNRLDFWNFNSPAVLALGNPAVRKRVAKAMADKAAEIISNFLGRAREANLPIN